VLPPFASPYPRFALTNAMIKSLPAIASRMAGMINGDLQ